ncbi:type III pantothenate kinase [Flavobacteriales bacterium]|nr:type III pantothenate kinase [Flavobacteriales bacterium]
MYFYIFDKNSHSLKLIIDIGNTTSKIALFDGKELIKNATFADLDLSKVKLFSQNHKITSSILSSVKGIYAEISDIVELYSAEVLSEKTPLPIINSYKTPLTLGKDRLAAVAGASVLYPEKDILVFDAGTCLTIDFINSDKEYIGGRISPGIEMRYNALHTFTDKLPLIKSKKNTLVIGNDTKTSIICGVQQGILAEVKAIISDYKSQNTDTVFVFTGGDSFYFEKELKNSIFANPNLVLIGLNEILDYNE